MKNLHDNDVLLQLFARTIVVHSTNDDRCDLVKQRQLALYIYVLIIIFLVLVGCSQKSNQDNHAPEDAPGANVEREDAISIAEENYQLVDVYDHELRHLTRDERSYLSREQANLTPCGLIYSMENYSRSLL